ncbi:Predicted RNA-binding protein, contains PUA-like domain [Kaistia soli DSM 19436]|uniref:Predicted RNA-binding protein, contains PUA-like domain n=1 Tax=Kaistia soli DSM 19436 TaxID=1122133 RepID=A0A1M5CLN0_9HYPH|nr:EVE domain-containing protein [Kaistia soli]SHF55638.1 Predicted RNA-binding protein, contains PUA-like domain [Kaistia soli DSM 19436]
MAHWLYKSEPDTFSFQDLVAKGEAGQEWDGVRNYQARNHMRAMKVGDRGFFYHSNEGKEIVGVVEVVKEIHPDSTDDSGTWECVDIRAVGPVKTPVTLVAAKAESRLKGMALVSNSRLSVQPVTDAEWDIVCEMAGISP